jgi:hypothetical protein
MGSWAAGFGLVSDRLAAVVMYLVRGRTEQNRPRWDEEDDDVLRSVGGIRCLIHGSRDIGISLLLVGCA